MKKILGIAGIVLLASCAHAGKSLDTISPNGKIEVNIADDGKLTATLNGDTLLQTPLGIVTTERSFADTLQLLSVSAPQQRHEAYDMLVGKRAHCQNGYTERDYTFVTASDDTLTVQVRAYDDGVAFRYLITPDVSEEIVSEVTTYTIPEGKRRWMQWYHADSYEDFYPMATDGAQMHPMQNHNWGYPALVQYADSVFVLLTEANIERQHAGAYLNNETDNTQYTVVYGSAMPTTEDTWASPWRVAIMGDLSDVVESTLVTDVSNPAVCAPAAWMVSGPAAWVYWAYNHGSSDYQIVEKYIDLAADMQWPYVLIDAEWDEMSNGGNIEDALAYAREKGVKPLIWYNSSVGWVDGAPTPKYRLNAKEDRLREMQWMQQQGVAGIKIDFFNGDGAVTNDYYLDLLEDGLNHNLLITFHGATLPRGWQRTYPNLMTVEGVYGAEWYNNLPVLTERAAAHNATLPFTRNVVGPMDYTPGTFTDSQHPHITTHAHELALMVLFESALQHMPDRPEAYASLPDDVRAVLQALPTAWDDTKLLAGYPGDYVVLARQKGDKWYIAGINGTDGQRTIDFSIERLGVLSKGILYADGDTDRSFAPSVPIDLTTGTITLPTRPRGGFLIVAE